MWARIYFEVSACAMLWIWVLPLAILAYVFAAKPVLSPWASVFERPNTFLDRLSYYFGHGCQARARCLDQLLITMPFYASVAYSLGALLARHAYMKTRQKNSSRQETALGPG